MRNWLKNILTEILHEYFQMSHITTNRDPTDVDTGFHLAATWTNANSGKTFILKELKPKWEEIKEGPDGKL